MNKHKVIITKTERMTGRVKEQSTEEYFSVYNARKRIFDIECDEQDNKDWPVITKAELVKADTVSIWDTDTRAYRN